MASVKQIDALLPQTQCGLCGYKGCMPYAEALVENRAAINLCPPGGVPGLLALAHLLEQDATPFITDMEKNAKPALRAVIREAECIGCTKCIQACPVDAILGAAKQMHTVITSECTGCELCVAPCPVDCIDIVAAENNSRPDYFRARYSARVQRLQEQTEKPSRSTIISTDNIEDKKAYIQAAILRNKAK